MLSPSVPTSIAPKRKNQYQPLHLETIDTDVISYLFCIPFKRNAVAVAPDASLNSRRFELFNLTSELLIGDFLFSVRFFELLYSLIQLFVLFLCPVAGLRVRLSLRFLKTVDSLGNLSVNEKDGTAEKDEKYSDDDTQKNCCGLMHSACSFLQLL